MKKFTLIVLCSMFSAGIYSQTYSPIVVSGFNIDAVAETYPNSLTTTTQALDQVVAGGNSVMYSAAFASAASFGGGLPNSGTIVNGLKTFQLMPYTGNNALFAPASTTNTLTLATPASYSNLNFLVFSTEGSSSFNITIRYTDLTTTNAGNFTVQDWFNGTSAIITGIGRCKRVASGVTNDGLPTNPRLYGIDVPVTCSNQQKLVESVIITGITSNPAGGGGYVLALSGVAANVVLPTVSYGSTILCQGSTTVSPTVTGAAGGTYTSFPAGLSMNGGDGIINPPMCVPDTYTITYSTTGACSVSATSTITVVPSPTVTVNNPTVCAGQTATLTASGASTYGWVGNNLSAITGSQVYANVASTSVYTLTGSTNGCSTTVMSTITVNPLPVVVTNAEQICPGSAAVLSATTSIPGGTYTWLPNNQTTSSITESPSASTNYTVIYTVNGCSASAIAAVNIQPVSALSVNSGSVCNGQSITLIASPSVGGGTYVWQPGGQTTSSISETPTAPGTYTVTYITNGCQVTAVASVGINPNPNAQVTSSAPSVAPMDEVSIVATGGNSYIWNTGATGSVINVKPLETTTYCATVTSVEGCKAEACVEVLVKGESTLYIPNVFTPNNDGINDQFYIPGYNLVEFDLKIFNRWGQLLFQTTDPLKGWDGSYKGETIAGVYVFILKAKGNDGTDYKKSGHITLIQ